jgi:hypothetical protein
MVRCVREVGGQHTWPHRGFARAMGLLREVAKTPPGQSAHGYGGVGGHPAGGVYGHAGRLAWGLSCDGLILPDACPKGPDSRSIARDSGYATGRFGGDVGCRSRFAERSGQAKEEVKG